MPPLGPRFRGDDNVGSRDDSVGACWRIIVKLKDVYPLYFNNKAVQPNTDLVVTEKFTREVAFRTALATPDVFDEARSDEQTPELQSLMLVRFPVVYRQTNSRIPPK